jgi:hypothetical protein
VSARDALAAIRERAEAATEGPWHRDRTNSLGAYVISVRNRAFTIVDGLLKRDAEFIAHARTDVPALVGALEAVLDLTAEWGSGMASPLYELGPDVATEIRTAIETALGPR